MSDLVKTSSDKERARSLIGMADTRLRAIELLKKESEFSSKIIEEYYEAILEMITALLSVRGYRTRSDVVGSHIASIDFLNI